MALKYTFNQVILTLQPASGGGVNSKAIVYFGIKDTASEGELKTGVSDKVEFTVTFPITKAGLKTQADTAITDKYPGATPV